MPHIRQDFRQPLDSKLGQRLQGVGQLEHDATGLRFIIRGATDTAYSNAQIDDYIHRKGKPFVWNPPLRMTVRASFSRPMSEYKGTAGFGFWRQPAIANRGMYVPASVWFFFASPPTDMSLAKGVPGFGWKAATLDATRLPFWLLLPTAPIGLLLMRIPFLYRLLWPIGQWAIGVSEALIDIDWQTPHTYRLDWLKNGVTFYIDDKLIHSTRLSPHGALGFVAWSDNRWAITTPQGKFSLGLHAIPDEQFMTLESLEIESL